MRVVHLSHDMEAIARIFSPDRALDAVRDRRDRTYDPALADLFLAHGTAWFDRLAQTEPWDAVLDLEPTPHRTLEGEALDDALAVAADFIDLKSPYMSGHSRRCAQLAVDAAQILGFGADDVTTVREPRCCTISAPRECPTRFGTSPAGSPAPSSIAWSCIRC